METLNTQLFLFINGLTGNRILDVTLMTIAEAAPYLSALVLVMVYLRGKRNAALCAFYAALLGLAINLTITRFYYHPRPFMLNLGHALLAHSPETSFPSDHATLSLTIALSLLFSGERISGALFLVYGLATGFARVYCGIHFPLDIAGSILVSVAASWVIHTLRHRLTGANRLIETLGDKMLLQLLRNGHKKTE
jgi:undecaprenyl-diphosphatase